MMTLPKYAMAQATFPEMYERELVGPLFRPWAELTLDEIGLWHRDCLLDIACGTGIVARLARERAGESAKIVGVDISEDMLAVAATVAPDIDWRHGNATALPLDPGERFDVVVCQQGLQFVADKAGAVREMRSALAPGGRLAVSTWRADEESPFFAELRSVAERHLEPIADQRYSFGSAEDLEQLLSAAGFAGVRSRVVTRVMRFRGDTPFVRMNAMALVGMSEGGMTLAEAERNRLVETIAAESASIVERYRDGPDLAFELRSNLATATT
jgi:ubiquinone/menaquinone biosynthesis C-methylase UbiE